jgi:putative transport protein
MGRIKFRNFSFGSIGVLIVALVFGHFNLHAPRGILDLGLLLFVYSAGLQAGPRFFRTFKRSKIHYLSLGFIPVFVACITALVMGHLLGLSKDLTIGLFSGALTDTTSLASAIDAIHKAGISENSELSVGYTVAYPFSMLAVLLAMHILPRLVKADLELEDRKWRELKSSEEPPVVVKQFRVTNPNCNGKTIRNLNPRSASEINFTYIQRKDDTLPADPDLEILIGDIVTVVAKASLSEELSLFLGEEVLSTVQLGKRIVSRDVLITESKLTGKTLGELRLYQKYKVRITHIRRQGMEFVAQGTSMLDIGDQIRVVGEPQATEEFVSFAGSRDYLVDETNMLPFLSGLFIGVILGSIPLKIGDEFEIQLGLAGGAFIVSLLMGHYGKIGSFSMYVPQAAKNLCRELGIILFLAAAGTYAGGDLAPILSQYGFGLLVSGAIVTLSSVLTAFALAHFVFKLNLLSTMGIMAGSMSNSSALGVIKENYSPSDLPALSYATVYPLSLIIKIVAAQLMVTLFNHL